MCIVSMILDDFQKRQAWPWHPGTVPYPGDHVPQDLVNPPRPIDSFQPVVPAISREEFEALKKEVAALRELIKAAKKYDEETNQPDCEMEDKKEFILKLGELLGIDMTGVF